MHIVIIGNGIAGITAARNIRKLSNHQITVISSENDYFFSRTALMYVYRGHLRWKDIMPYEPWFWKKNKITLVKEYVASLKVEGKTLSTSSGKQYTYDQLIIATGSQSNRPEVPGASLDGVASLYTRQDLEYIQSKSAKISHAVIVGGGLIGVELAEMFHSRNIGVTFLVRESSYAEAFLPSDESAMVNEEIRHHGIDLRLNTQLKAIIGDDHGRVKSVITSTGEEIKCQFVATSIGVHPNISWLGNSSIETNTGILVDEFLQTNIPDVYAIGDCAEIRIPAIGRKAIEPVWYTGRIMGETVANTICGYPVAYTPGIWFNSAKFFNIEYQIYGVIRPSMAEGHKTVFWQHPDGKRSIRINYTTAQVIGFNLMGVRFRQEVCEKWINTNTKIDTVLASLELALFDPEFSTNYATYVRGAYRALTGISITAIGKVRYNQVYSFLKKSSQPSL